jgi:hypothetical protein
MGQRIQNAEHPLPQSQAHPPNQPHCQQLAYRRPSRPPLSERRSRISALSWTTIKKVHHDRPPPDSIRRRPSALGSSLGPAQ